MSALVLVFALPTAALTESEVIDEVNRIGKEGVTGNIFVWFLCAVAFLKVSQKIDSFMSSIGVNVGNTGGSMPAEAMIAVRSIGTMSRAVGGNGFSSGKNGGASTGTNAFKGGLSGIVSRGVTGDAVKNANGSKNSGIGGMAYSTSLSKGGGFANKVIGSIANGNIDTMGNISGDGASEALMSYMGYTALGENSEDVPYFNSVEIGGGRITGNEITSENPEGIAFAMYSADKYSAPEGEYTTVTSSDGVNWYKQYAENTIIQKPYTHDDGHIERGERIEKRMPKAPPRKDRQ